MPVGLIAAGVTAAATVGGALISSGSQKSAANKASDTALQTADKNNALQRDIYASNTANLSPFMQRGNAAGDAINALLLGSPSQSPQGAPQSPVAHQYAPAGYQPTGAAYAPSGGDYGADMYGGPTMRTGRSIMDPATGYGTGDMYQIAGDPAAGGATGTSPGAPAPSAYENAFKQYLDSTGYKFRVGQGQDGINTGYAARGLIQSGAAMKAMDDYRQGMASNEFGKYLGYLSNQQGVGLSGASAVAGVGQGYANSVSANNNSAGTAAANAALAGGNATANMWSGIAGGIGNAAGQYMSSYGSGSGYSPNAFVTSPVSPMGGYQAPIPTPASNPWGGF